MKNRFFILAILFISVSILSAQSISVGPQLGFSKANNADKATVMPSAAVRLDLIGLGVEGSIGYKMDKFDGGQVKTTSYPILLTGMLNVLPIIHAEAGIGWYNTKIEYSNTLNLLGNNNETKQKIGYHLGAGASIPLGTMELTGDLRYIFMKDDSFRGLTSAKSLKYDYYTLVIGALFKL